jgi:LPXTG-motif cell wall-anchored protein
MRSLAAAYAVLALLAMPALLWAAEEPPPATTPTTPAETTTSTTPSPKVVEEEIGPPAVEEKEPVATAAASGGVTIEDFAFSPGTITVDQGESVAWTNRDGVGHTATADDGSFDTGTLNRGESGSQQFDEPGTYPYHCTPHPNMTGKVVVRAASSGAGTGSGDDTADTGTGTTGSTSTTTSSDSTLPATGIDVAIVALGGMLLLAGGALLRRRVED